MESNHLSFNDLPEAVARLSSKLDHMERLISSLLTNQSQSSDSKDDQKLTLREAAEYCRMKVPTFRDYLRRREVSGSKSKKSWLFTKKDLDAFLERYRVLSVDEAQTHCQTIKRVRRVR